LLKVFEERIDEAGPDDYSRLIMMCLHLNDAAKARYYTEQGLLKDESIPDLHKLAKFLGVSFEPRRYVPGI
jgi:hypothetical protein